MQYLYMKKDLLFNRIGIFGGTFNPPHNAHLAIADRVKSELKLKKIYFIPAFIPPHKRIEDSADSRNRLKMVKLAVKGKEGFRVSDIELKRRGISYTIDTLVAFKKKYPKMEFVLIVGADNLSQFQSWKSQNGILRLASLAVYGREGYNNALKKKEIKFYTIRGKLLKISSTEIRKRVSKGQSIIKLVPKPVADYIRRHALYK